METFKKIRISFEIEATESGAKSLRRQVKEFLSTKTNWAYENLRYEIIN